MEQKVLLVLIGLITIGLGTRQFADADHAGVIEVLKQDEYKSVEIAQGKLSGSTSTKKAPAPKKSGKININTADVKELMLLHRVGPKTAEKIIAHRKENGNFESIEDIMKVKGIGEKTFENFKDMITVSASGSSKAPSKTTNKTSKTATKKSGKTNINTASSKDLQKLPGLGEAYADRIVEYRKANGSFKKVEDLAKVPGIGAKTVEKLKDKIDVKDATPVKATKSTKSGGTAKASKSASSGQININTATGAELEKIKGVGPATAENIIDYRKANGKFKSINDLTKVKGIGAKTVDSMKDQITVGK